MTTKSAETVVIFSVFRQESQKREARLEGFDMSRTANTLSQRRQKLPFGSESRPRRSSVGFAGATCEPSTSVMEIDHGIG